MKKCTYLCLYTLPNLTDNWVFPHPGIPDIITTFNPSSPSPSPVSLSSFSRFTCGSMRLCLSLVHGASRITKWAVRGGSPLNIASPPPERSTTHVSIRKLHPEDQREVLIYRRNTHVVARAWLTRHLSPSAVYSYRFHQIFVPYRS